MGTRRRARELALQLLYQYEMTGASIESMQSHFEEWDRAPEGVRNFADDLLRGALENSDRIDEYLSEQSAHWKLERLATVDKNILRLAIFELLFHDDTPPAVVIDEAIEIAKKFGAEESARFVNGVLDGVLRRKKKS